MARNRRVSSCVAFRHFVSSGVTHGQALEYRSKMAGHGAALPFYRAVGQRQGPLPVMTRIYTGANATLRTYCSASAVLAMCVNAISRSLRSAWPSEFCCEIEVTMRSPTAASIPPVTLFTASELRLSIATAGIPRDCNHDVNNIEPISKPARAPTCRCIWAAACAATGPVVVSAVKAVFATSAAIFA